MALRSFTLLIGKAAPHRPMNYLDIVLAILLLVGLVRGFMKGFIFEIAMAGSIFLGMYAAFKLSYLLQPMVMKLGNLNPNTVSIICSLLMFTLVCVGLFFLAKLFTGLVNMAALGIFNKLLGAVFGLLKYAFIISILLYFVNMMDTKHQFLSADIRAESRLYYPVMNMAPSLLPVMKEMKNEVAEATDKWKDKLLQDRR